MERPLGFTNLSQWRLDSSSTGGRHAWHYSSSQATDEVWGPDPLLVSQRHHQTEEEKFWLGIKLDDKPEDGEREGRGRPKEAARKGFEFLKRIQSEDGHWACEYGGPLFVAPGLVFAMHVTGTPIPTEWKIELARYMANVQRNFGAGDQGWGLHIEGVSTVFGTVLNYVMLRILGVSDKEPMMKRARSTILNHGGAAAIPSWGKFWLSILNLYAWEGCNPFPSELWLVPDWFPMSPTRFWSYNRMVFLPMCHLYSLRFQTPLTPLLSSLREEIYLTPYSSLNWPQQRNNISPIDLYAPHPWILDFSFSAMSAYNKFHLKGLRQNAIDYTYELIRMEDENTGYQGQAPVNKAMNMIARWVKEGSDSEAFKKHKETISDFLWMTKDGLLACGTNGTQLWDLSFITQSLVESSLALEPSNRTSVLKILNWLERSQIRDDPKWFKEMSRHSTKGAWGFSTKMQGYTVSDCTAEGLKAVLLLQELEGIAKVISTERLCEAVDIIISLQNVDGGFASCELVRGGKWLEWFNPTEMFKDLMIEKSYPECTTACLTALSIFKKSYPDYRRKEIEQVSQKAVSFMHSCQEPDGSWFGSWAVCFTYATMFALESLSLAGETVSNSVTVAKACKFLLSKQMDDGGWGESFESCVTGVYTDNSKSQVTNTAWAVLGLLAAKCEDYEAIRRGCRLIMSRQLQDGRWEQESIEGVFNKNCSISYPLYKISWSIKALGMAEKIWDIEGN